MAALIPIFIQAIPSLIKAGGAVAQFVHNFRAAAQQSGAWTDAHEADYQSQLTAANDLPESKLDSEL